MIPEPPAPLVMLPALDRLEVVLPPGMAWRRGLVALVAGLLALLVLWGACMVALQVLLFSLLVTGSVYLIASVLITLLCLVPAAVLFGLLHVVARGGEAVVRADRRGISFGGELVPWEGLREVRADGDAVAIMLADGSWEDVATELPQAASWWLAAALANLHDRALSEAIDDDGLDQVRRARAESPSPPPRPGLSVLARRNLGSQSA